MTMEDDITIQEHMDRLWMDNGCLYVIGSILFLTGLTMTLASTDYLITGLGISLAASTAISLPSNTIIEGYTGIFVGVLGSMFAGSMIAFAFVDMESAFVASYGSPAMAILLAVFIKYRKNISGKL